MSASAWRFCSSRAALHPGLRDAVPSLHRQRLLDAASRHGVAARGAGPNPGRKPQHKLISSSRIGSSSKGSSPYPRDKSSAGSGASPSMGMGLFFVASFLSLGVRLPYWPVWMSEVRGLSSTEIGALLGVTQIARLAAGPTVGLIADLTRAPRTLAIVLAVLCTLAYSGMLLPVQIPLLVALACLAVSLSSAAVALGESVAVTTIANEDYGRVRLWGSLAFVAANVIGGRILSGTGAAQVMPMLICSSGMLIFASLGLPRRCKAAEEDLRGPNYPAASRADTLSEARSLVTSPVFLLFLLASCSIQSAHATYYSFSTIMLQGAGHTGSAIGMVWAAGVAAEVIIFAEKRMHAALSPWQLMAIGGCAAVVRWAVMSSSPTLPLLLATQGLHAFTFGATHLGAIKFLQAAIPSEISATSYAIYAAVSDGIFMAAASYAAGLLFAVHGQQGAYLAMSGLGFGGACAAALLGRVWNGQALHLGNEKGLC